MKKINAFIFFTLQQKIKRHRVRISKKMTEIEEYLQFFEKLWKEGDNYMPANRRRLREWADARNFTFYDMGLAEFYEERDDDADSEVLLDPNSSEARYAHFEQHAGLLHDYIHLEMSRKEYELGPCSAFPGQELHRYIKTDKPRNWKKRWREAYESLPPEEQKKALKSKMVALVHCDIWRRLSVFGLPYPPFDYGSGMGLRSVSFDECRKMRILTEDMKEELRKLYDL